MKNGFTMKIMGIEATNILVEWGYFEAVLKDEDQESPELRNKPRVSIIQEVYLQYETRPIGEALWVDHIADILEIEWEQTGIKIKPMTITYNYWDEYTN